MKKFLLINLSIFFLLISSSHSLDIENIKVVGNDRVSKNTIISFTKIDLKLNLDDILINDALKNLYETKFFEDVKISLNEDNIIIQVKEFPIIQSIKVTGVKAEKMSDMVLESISLKEKSPFNKNDIKVATETITNSFKRTGYYFVKVIVKEKFNENNTLDLIFDLNLGDKALIEKIQFIGDKKIKDRRLSTVITSEENKFWKFISRNKYLDIDRINLDKRLLKNYYLDNGYYKVDVKDAYSQLTNNNNFLLTFKIDAGEKYYFNNLNLSLPDDYDPKAFKLLTKIFKNLKGEMYSYNNIEKILDEIDEISLNANYEFLEADIVEKITDRNKININFNIKQAEQFFVERIDIFGNTVTKEEFIRHQLIVDEGDPFNNLLLKKTINNIKGKRIFGKVDYEILEGSSPNTKKINITVEDKATGEISAGAGYGTDGTSVAFSIRENNYKGIGASLVSSVNIRADSLKGSLSYTVPNFAYTNRSLTTSFENTAIDRLSKSGYKTTLTSIGFGTGYESFKDLFFKTNISIDNETLTTDSTASANFKKQEGSYFDSNLSYSLTYDKRDNKFRPKSGYLNQFVQNIPIVADDAAVLNGIESTLYRELSEDMIFTVGFYGRAINSINENDVRVSKRLFIPSKRLRGFEFGKVGPKDGLDYIGGNYITSFNTNITVPYIFNTLENMDAKLFFDAANIWGVDYSNAISDSNLVRTSIGTALDFISPIGPMSFSLSKAISKEKTDVTESFRFNIGTTF